MPILPLAFSMITLQPMLQALWITCTLWISKAMPRKFVAECIQSLVFLCFISISSLDLFNRELRPSGLTTPLFKYFGPSEFDYFQLPRDYVIRLMPISNSIYIGILLAGYIVLSAWVILDLKARQLGAYSYMGCLWRMSTRLLTGLALIAIAIGCMVGIQRWNDVIFVLVPTWHYLKTSAASILGFQTFWLALEFAFEQLAIPRIRKRGIRGSLIVCVIILLFFIDESNRLRDKIYISLYDIFPGLCLAMCICGVWVVLWPVLNMLAGGIFLMLRRIL